MVSAAGPAAGMTVAPTAILAVAATGMFISVMWLILGMARHRTRPAPGHQLRPRRRHNRPAPWPPEHASRDRGARAASFGVDEEWYEGAAADGRPRVYGPPQLWSDVPGDPRDWR